MTQLRFSGVPLLRSKMIVEARNGSAGCRDGRGRNEGAVHASHVRKDFFHIECRHLEHTFVLGLKGRLKTAGTQPSHGV